MSDIYKVDIVSDNDPEPIQVGEDVEFDATDEAYPIAVNVDGYITLEDAQQLHRDIGKAIDLAIARRGGSSGKG